MEVFSIFSQYDISTKKKVLISPKKSGGIINESLVLGAKN